MTPRSGAARGDDFLALETVLNYTESTVDNPWLSYPDASILFPPVELND